MPRLAMPVFDMPHLAMPFFDMPCLSMKRQVTFMPSRAMPCHVMPLSCRGMPCHAMPLSCRAQHNSALLPTPPVPAGCSINPARSLGPAIVSGTWPTSFWIFVVGPFLGAIASVPLHLFFASKWFGGSRGASHDPLALSAASGGQGGKSGSGGAPSPDQVRVRAPQHASAGVEFDLCCMRVHVVPPRVWSALAHASSHAPFILPQGRTSPAAAGAWGSGPRRRRQRFCHPSHAGCQHGVKCFREPG